VNSVNDINIPKMQFLSSAINQLLPIHEIHCTAHIVSANEVKIFDGLKLYPKILQFKNKQLALQYILSEITKIQTTQPAYFLNILFRHSIEMVKMHNHQVTSDDLKSVAVWELPPGFLAISLLHF